MKPYFTDDEISGLDTGFVARLVDARSRAMTPFVITEGVGTGGHHVANTAHGRGLAADLRVHDSVTRFKILRALIEAGFTRIGIYDHHIHVDSDPSLPQGVCWFGGESH